mmetsp:Transcript_13294/g.45989  ORF Transcript_13294/g.45989 Transcript_13294/m.45989 type:complete len:324 (+) Transcript_13294:184-1155(+)
MPAEDRKRVMDLCAFLLNIVSSTGIIMVNKRLMSPPPVGCDFKYATTLCGLHYLFTMGVASAIEWWNKPTEREQKAAEQDSEGEKKGLGVPLLKIVVFVIIADMSIIGMNMSLMLNTVGFYQVSKLAMIPATALFELVFQKKEFSARVLLCIFTVLAGVGIATVTDVQFSWGGAMAALIGLLTTAGQQVMINQLQKQYNITASALMAQTSPMQAATMLLLGPWVDEVLTGGSKVWEYEYHIPATTMLMVSCAFAGLVNISQYMCIGRFTAVTFQVLGHVKTVLVLTLGFLLFDAVITAKNILGIVIAVGGMVAYGNATLKKPT